MKYATLLLLTLSACTGAPRSADAQNPPASQPAPLQTQPADSAETDATQDETQQWLTRIAERTQRIKTLRADLFLTTIQGVLGDEQRRNGTLTYSAVNPAKFDATFDRLIVNRRAIPQGKRYTYDGRWLAERDEQNKVFIRYEIAKEGEEKDLLAMGRGPFALPLGLDREAINNRFDVATVDPSDDDPTNTVHLRLMPKDHLRIDEIQIDLWYDRDTLLPVRAATLDDSERERIIEMENVVVDEPIDDTRFDTSPPEDRAWTVEVRPLEQR